MSRSNLKPIDMQAHFGATRRGAAPLAKPVPSAKALHQRRQAERLQAASTPIRTGTVRETYTGGELMHSTRAGAMDAMRLPSVLMGQRVQPKGAQS